MKTKDEIKREKELEQTVFCLFCGQTFQSKAGDAVIICPYCGKEIVETI